MARGVRARGRGGAASLIAAAILLAAPSRAQDAPVETTPAPPTAATTAPAPVPPDITLPQPPTDRPDTPDAPGLPPGQGNITAALLHYEEGARRWIATGNVEIRYRQYILRGDMGDYDEATETATLRGNVSLDTGRNVMRGGPDAVLTFYFPDRTWAFTRATTELRLSGLLAPVHVSAGALSGTRQQITLRDVRVTTCPPENPQYELSAREVTLVPNRRIIARRATTTLFGRRLWTLPSVTLPIRRDAVDRPPVVPVIGQSTDEGAYIKTNINYASSRTQNGALRVDLMQRQGIGLGVKHDYTLGGATGQAGLYSVGGLEALGQGNLTANLRHRQRLLGFDTTLQGELRRNAYQYLPGTASRNATLALTRASGASDTQLSFRYDNTRGTGTSYRNLNSSLAQSYRYSRRGTVRLNLDDAQQSATDYSNHELTTRVDVTQGFGAADAQIAINRLSTFGENNALGFKPVQRLPEIMLRSDARRLGLTNARTQPVQLQLSTGWFEANNVKSDRQMFQADVPVRTLRLGGTRLDLGGGFRQAVYSSDAMQYSVNASARLTQPLGDRSDLALSWAVQRPRGYTPFLFDRPFAYNTLTGSLRVADFRGLEVRLGTGYDLRNDITPWRDLLGFVLFQPSPGVRFATNVAVNVNGKDPGQESNIRYVNNALRLRLGRFHFDGESRYLPSTGRFGRLLGNLSTPVSKSWSVRALMGTTSGQRYRRLLVVKDMGCMEGYVAAVDDRGWRTERGVRFMLRIKAFPMAEPFSAGMFGENLDIGAADVTYGGIADGPLSTTPSIF